MGNVLCLLILETHAGLGLNPGVHILDSVRSQRYLVAMLDVKFETTRSSEGSPNTSNKPHFTVFQAIQESDAEDLSTQQNS